MSLEARGLTFAYPGGRPLFRDLSLEVGPGERVALTAPSGTGKTTLCRILAGYMAPLAGEVLVDGGPVARPSGPRPVQLIWQHPERAFDPLVRIWRSVGEARPAARGERAVGEALEGEGLMGGLGIDPAWLDRFPHELSGGELMRLALARALLAGPRYLIADEMTAMLDALTQMRIWRATIAVAEERGMGMIVVSHAPGLVARVATRSVELGR